MTTQLVIVEESVLRCHAPHPLDGKAARFNGRTCNRRVGPPLPFRFRATGRVWRRDDPTPPHRVVGRVYIECTCGGVTEYEVVAPPPAQS